MNLKAWYGVSYFMTYIDDIVYFDHIYLISHKFKALDYFRRYLIEVEI